MPPSNQIRIAALSNYKLSQLTFAPPDNCTLRKTALIKNIVEIIYQHTPNEYLTTQMKRWNYFTPESLEDMTQKDVEKIIYRYSQILYSTAISLGKNSIKKEQQFLYSDYPNITAETKEMNEFDSYYTSFFSSSIFAKDTFQDELASSSEFDNDHQEDLFFLPEQLPQQQKNTKLEIAPDLSSMYQLKYPNNDNNNNEKGTSRFSWLSDTGVPTNSTLALNLANELMSLFDMEFNVDLSVPSLHDLKKLESSNGSTTSLHKMFSVNEYLSSDDEDDGNLQQELKAVQVNKVNINMTAERQLPIQQKQQQPKNKVFKLIPNLKQLGNKNSKSNSDDIISSDLFNIEPAAPTHSNFTTSHMPPHKPNYQFSHSSSSSGSDKSEQEEEEEEKEEDDDDDDEDSDDINSGTIAHEMRCNHLGSLQRVTPPSRTSSLDYRASLRDRFELSDENSSDTSSDYFNDSVDTFQVELNCSRDSAGIDSQTFKGFLNALSSIRKTKSRRSCANSIHQDIEQHHSSYTTIPSIDASFQTAVGEDPAFDTFSLNSTDKKHKNSIQKMVKCISGNGSSRHNSSDSRNLSSYHRNSSISNTSSVSAPSTTMSSSSLFSNEQTPNNKQYYRCNTKTPTSPTTFSPRVAKRDEVYTTSIISDTSSFNWVDETCQKEDFSSVRSEASSGKTMSTFFSNNNRQPQCLSRSSSTTSLGGFFKKLTTLNKKDKILQRA
ncbi:hypothetical protein INT46_001615 [Mucor plumbeus]|uniref:Uncharacterized protein n=1 Tax=Mucor plumbeus TaxID=97098 RepID=A0A8H7UTD8_9FUNG|nr:hypothetical protein INT46_001615 [Mucor plumbeus]